MRIGIDATPLPPNPVGAGNYIIHLIRQLAMLDCAHQFVVFVHASRRALIDTGPAAPLPRLEWVVLPDQPPARRLVWEQATLPRLARRQGLNLLHSLHYTMPLGLSCKSVVTFHDLTFFFFPHLHTRVKRVFFPLAMRVSARRANALVADSESTRRDAMRVLNIPPERIFTAPLGISESFHLIDDIPTLEACRQRYRLPSRFLLFVGLVEPRKNLPLLLQAYAGLRQGGECPPLVVVGRFGWDSDEVMRQVEALGLKDQVLFTGYVPVDDLPMVYNLSTIFIYPSLYEGFGFPPLEAMACGVPVITTGVSSMLDNVGDAGLLTPPNDVTALQAAMRRLLDDPGLRQDLAQRGQQQAAEFTWRRTALETLKAYQYAASH